jgi:hypothetical protein
MSARTPLTLEFAVSRTGARTGAPAAAAAALAVATVAVAFALSGRTGAGAASMSDRTAPAGWAVAALASARIRSAPATIE